MPRYVCVRNRIVPTVREHIIAEEALAGACETVGVDEALDYRVIITALEVIESRFYVLIVAASPIFAVFMGSFGGIFRVSADGFAPIRWKMIFSQEADCPASYV